MDESCIVCDGLDGQLAKEGDMILSIHGSAMHSVHPGLH